MSPTGHNAPDSAWSNEGNAYDEDTGTKASTNVPGASWSSFLELTIYSILCSKVRFFARYEPKHIVTIDLDAYRDGAWADVFQGQYDSMAWVEKTFTEGTVTAARVRFWNPAASPPTWPADLYEFDFWGAIPISISDAGVGSDSLQVLSKVGIADAGVGIDSSPQITAKVAIAEAAVGQESIGVRVATVITDGGVGQEAISWSRVLSKLDRGIGQDAVSVVAKVTLADAGEGAETVSITVAVPLSDGGTGTTLLKILNSVRIADQGLGQETVAILAKIGIVDAGQGTDVLSLIKALVSISDAGSGAETIEKHNWVPTVGIQVVYSDGQALAYPARDAIEVPDPGAELAYPGRTAIQYPTREALPYDRDQE